MSKSYNIRTCIAHPSRICKVIELLSSLGFSAEVRRFLTSAVMSIQPAPGSIYSPPGLEPVDINNPLIFLHAAIDNFDQNEETLDGKSTTRAMAKVIYQHITNGSLEYNIDRTKAKSIYIAILVTTPLLCIIRNLPHVQSRML